MKIGIFGGTFNPIHYGHLRAAEEIREKFNLAKIIFIPSNKPPLKTHDLLGSEHRYKMTEIALSGNSFFEISDIEFKTNRNLAGWRRELVSDEFGRHRLHRQTVM